MAPASGSVRVSDSDYVFQLFCDSGPMTIDVASIAKKRGLNPKSIVDRLRNIKKKNPGFELSGSAKGGSALRFTDVVSTPEATPAKKASKITNKPTASKADARRRTRSVSKAEAEEASEDEELVVTVNKKNGKKISTKDKDSNKENEPPIPRTRGGRKSVGRKLEQTAVELPKPAPRGRNAIEARIEEDDTTLIAEEDPMQSVEDDQDKTSPLILPRKVETTSFARKLINESYEHVETGFKRKRTPSPDKRDQSALSDTAMDMTDTAPILTPPESPSKRPPAKKQKLVINKTSQDQQVHIANSDVVEESEKSIETIQDPDAAEAIEDGAAQESITNITEAETDSAVESVIEQDLEPNVVIVPEMPAQALLSLVGEKSPNLAQDIIKTDIRAASPKLFPWMSWDPDAVPDSSSTEGLGRVVSNEYAQNWRGQNRLAG